MKIGDKVKVTNSRRSYNENGGIGVIVDETDRSWIVAFGGKDGECLDYLPDEIELVEEKK